MYSYLKQSISLSNEGSEQFFRYILLWMLLVLFFFLNLLSCRRDNIINPSDNHIKRYSSGDTIEISFKETVYIENPDRQITFDSLLEDSRCPYGVMCVWEGNAEISLLLYFNGTETRYNLNTYKKFQRYTVINNYKILLTGVLPYPEINIPIIIDDYSVKIHIHKLSNSRSVILDNGVLFNEWPDDPYDIKSASIENDSIFMEVQYGGGCKEHIFNLVTNNYFRESYNKTVLTGIFLSHYNNHDDCKALITETLKFDLTPLKESYHNYYPGDPGPLIINLSNSSTGDTFLFLTYNF